MSTTTCPRCSECMGCEHHWIADPTPERDYVCKHCDAFGDMCLECSGDGCESCKDSGVVPCADIPGYDEINRMLNRVPMTWLGGILACVVERLLEVNFFKTPDDLRKYVDAIIKRNEP